MEPRGTYLELKIQLVGKPARPEKLLISVDGKCIWWEGLARGLSNILDKRPLRRSIGKAVWDKNRKSGAGSSGGKEKEKEKDRRGLSIKKTVHWPKKKREAVYLTLE